MKVRLRIALLPEATIRGISVQGRPSIRRFGDFAKVACYQTLDPPAFVVGHESTIEGEPFANDGCLRWSDHEA